MTPSFLFQPVIARERWRRYTSTHRWHAFAMHARFVTLVVGGSMAIPQPASSELQKHTRGTALPRLIVADGLLALAARWKSELAILRRRSVASDSVRTLADCIQELVDAINAGHEITVRLTIAEAHAVSRIPLSTLRWLCSHRADAVGAHKHGGAWYVDRTCFESYLASCEGRNAIPRGASRRAVPNTERVIHRQTATGADLRVEGA